MMRTRMRRGVLGLILAWGLLVVPLSAWSYLGFEQIAVGATAIGFTASTINAGSGHTQATSAECRARTAEISFTIDGTTPTATVGTLLEIGDVRTLEGHDVLALFRAIRTTAVSGQLDCNVSAQ